MKYFILGFCIVLCFISTTHAQNDSEGGIKADVNTFAVVALPLQPLKGEMDNGYGIGFSVLMGKKGFPMKGGMTFNTLWNNQVSVDTYFFNGYFDEEYDLVTTSYTFQCDAIIRAEPETDFPIIPFADVFLGFNRFATWSSIDGDDAYDDDPDLDNFDDTYREMADFTWAYGAAGGIRIRVNEFDEESDFDIVIQLRAAYRKGGGATFLAKKDEFTIIDSSIEGFEERRSITNMMTFQLGLSLKIP